MEKTHCSIGRCRTLPRLLKYRCSNVNAKTHVLLAIYDDVLTTKMPYRYKPGIGQHIIRFKLGERVTKFEFTLIVCLQKHSHQ